jgi:gamma-glutamyl hercynylcysteine S-oxide synthase
MPAVAPPSVALARDLDGVRARTLDLVAGLDDDALHAPLDPIMSPLVWDLGHIAAYEDLWAVHRLGGEPLLRGDLAAVYDAFETPRTARADVELLDRREAIDYLAAVRERTLAVLDRTGPHELHELVLRHELQHTETMRQALFLGSLPGGEPHGGAALPADPDWLTIPAGEATLGADRRAFAYDNERPRHAVELGAFRITRAPIANATFLRFVEGGGYERREWWSDEGWAWKEEYDITHPMGWTASPGDPVEHVSWFEAAAFARSLGARLPTEAEWERAATWDHGTVLEGVGRVWEWTATEFDGYPGFRAHPYREYSEVFFRRGYRVLRGGSWATSPRIATATFRNWDWPERRQIFSGIRLAQDAS